MRDPLKHKDSIVKMLMEEKWRHKKSLKRRFLRGGRDKEISKNCKPFTAAEEMGGIPHEPREKNAQGDDLPWWMR